MIAILAAILLPALNKARERGRAAACVNNLKQIATAHTMYTIDYKDYSTGAFNINNRAEGQMWYRNLLDLKLIRPAILSCASNLVSGTDDCRPGTEHYLPGFGRFGREAADLCGKQWDGTSQQQCFPSDREDELASSARHRYFPDLHRMAENDRGRLCLGQGLDLGQIHAEYLSAVSARRADPQRQIQYRIR